MTIMILNKNTRGVKCVNFRGLPINLSYCSIIIILENNYLIRYCHIEQASTKAETRLSNLAEVMPHTGGTRSSKKLVICSVVHNILLYDAYNGGTKAGAVANGVGISHYFRGGERNHGIKDVRRLNGQGSQRESS
ncbi:hypothetical protein QE152_g24430 [Popillia japonica]|uniref:Uncharacterized protein n=1 Tax=Popillia japonica TaxID=7064 RepID=A0AAW1KFS9_POPJA